MLSKGDKNVTCSQSTCQSVTSPNCTMCVCVCVCVGGGEGEGETGQGVNLFVDKWNQRKIIFQVIFHWFITRPKKGERFLAFQANCVMCARQ